VHAHRILLPLCLALAPRAARASGFDAPQIGHAQSGPVTADAAAVHWNPGQLGYVDRPELYFGLGLAIGSVGVQRERRGQYQYADNLDFAEPIDPADIDPSRTGTDRRVRTTPVGPLFDLFVAIPAIRDRLVVGLGFYVPYAAILHFPTDGPQRFGAQSVLLTSTHLTASLAVRAHDVISIGAGVSYALSFFDQSKVQDFGALDTFGDSLARPPIAQPNDFGGDAPSTVRELDVLARQVDIDNAVSHGVSFNAGIALRPTDRLRLGLVYQHGSRLRFRGKFRLDMDDEFFTQDLAAQGLQYPPLVRGTATVEASLPKRITLGAGGRITKRFGLDGFVSYVFYQDFDVVHVVFDSPDLAQEALGVGNRVAQDVVRDWKGVVNVELNARIEATDKLRVSTTLGYHMPASPDSTIDASSPDGHRIIAGVGIGYAFNDRFALFADAEVQPFVKRKVTTSDYDLGNGTYDMLLAALQLHGQVKLGRRHKGAAPDAKRRPKSAPKPRAEPPRETAPIEKPPEKPTDQAAPPIDAPPPPPAVEPGSVPPPPPPPPSAEAV
jgi:long-chain fatty acid transport protein